MATLLQSSPVSGFVVCISELAKLSPRIGLSEAATMILHSVELTSTTSLAAVCVLPDVLVLLCVYGCVRECE